MAKIQFENGTVVEFDGTPTEQDIEEVAKQFDQPAKKSSPKEKSGFIWQALAGATEALPKTPELPFLPSANKAVDRVMSEVPKPQGFIQGAGRFLGNSLAYAPAAAMGAGIAGPQLAMGGVARSAGMQALKSAAPLIGSGIGIGAQDAVVDMQNGKSGTEAVLGGALTAGGVIAGGLALQGTGKLIGAGVNRIKGVPKDFEPILAKNAEEFRNIINPGKNEIKNLEVLGNKNINDYFKLAAQEKLIINKSVDNKLDTTLAREALTERINVYEDQLQKLLQVDKSKQFNIKDLAAKVRSKLRADIKNDSDYQDAVKELNKQVAAVVKERGSQLNTLELNEIKRGMWAKSYDALKPNSKNIARTIGFVAKNEIEKTYPSGIIGIVNQRLGKYLTLDTLLENAHGRVVARGKIGKYGAEVVGGLAGQAIGNKLGPLGPIIGAVTGGKVNEFLTNPERITRSMANRLRGYNMPDLKTPVDFSVNPEVMTNAMQAALKGLPSKASKGLPLKPKELPFKKSN